MKVRTQTVAPRAARLFTDREEPRAAFWQNYEQFRQEIARGEANIHVLNYYGIGGIGKSRLLRQLASELEEKLPDPHYVYFDFNVAQERRAVLTALKNKLTERYHFQFPLFDLCSYVYARGVGEDAASPEVKKLTDGSPVLSLLLSVAENIPIVGIGAKVLSLADQGLATLRSYLKLHQRDLTWLESQDPEDLYAKLPAFFAQDLNHNLESAEQPLVLFLDTYERLVNEMSSVGAPLNHDQWLRDANGPIQNTLNTMWVIAGREKLKWAQLDSDWEDALETHILGSLSPTDSDRFLYAAGVGGKQLRGELYELTRGTPVYLDLCVDQFLRLTQQGIVPGITMFGQNTYDLIERFVRYMDDTLKDIVYVMAFLERWDDRTLTDIAVRVLPNFSLTTYEKVKEFSFVIQSEEDTFNIHQTVGDVLATYCPKALKDAIVRCALDYFTDKLKAETVRSADFAGHLRYAMQFALLEYPEDKELLEFYLAEIDNRCGELLTAGLYAQTQAVLDLFRGRAEQSPNTLLYAESISAQTSVLYAQGSYSESLSTSKALLALLTDIVGEDHHRTLSAARLQAAILIELGELEQAQTALSSLLDRHRTLYPEEHLTRIRIMNTLFNNLDRQEKHTESLQLARTALDEALRYLPDDAATLAIVRNNLAVAMSQTGKLEEARSLFEETLTELRKTKGESHLDTLDVTSNLASTMADQQQYDGAIELYQKVIYEMEPRLGSLHPKVLTEQNNLAYLYLDTENYSEAAELFQRVLEGRMTILGPDHRSTLSTRRFLSHAFYRLEQFEKALPCIEEVVSRRQTLLGCDHPDTLQAMDDLASTLTALNRHENAVALRRKILALWREQSGEDALRTLRAELNIGLTLYDASRPEEAAAVLEPLVTRYRELYGDRHEDTQYAVSLYAITLHNAGRTGKAISLLQQLLKDVCALHGKDSPQAITTRTNLARLLSHAGQEEESLEMLRQIHSHLQKAKGPTHRDTLDILREFAVTLHDLGRNEEALSAMEEVATGLRACLGEDHWDTLVAEHNQAILLHKLSRDEESLAMFFSLVSRLQAKLGPKHKRTLLALLHITYPLNNLGRNEEALVYGEQAAAGYQETLGETHPDTLRALHDLAFTLDELGKHEEAAALYRKVLADRRQVLGDYHSATLTTIINLSYVLDGLKRYEEALSLRQEALTLRKSTLGENHPDTLAALHQLAYTLYDLELYEQALPPQLAAAEGRMQVLGEDHPDTLVSTHNLAMLHFKREDYQEARKWMEWSIERRRKVFGESHPKTLKSMKRLSEILAAAGCIEEQQALDKKIEELEQSATQ